LPISKGLWWSMHWWWCTGILPVKLMIKMNNYLISQICELRITASKWSILSIKMSDFELTESSQSNPGSQCVSGDSQPDGSGCSQPVGFEAVGDCCTRLKCYKQVNLATQIQLYSNFHNISRKESQDAYISIMLGPWWTKTNNVWSDIINIQFYMITSILFPWERYFHEKKKRKKKSFKKGPNFITFQSHTFLK